MGEAKRKAKRAKPGLKAEHMEISGLYCMGFHDKHWRPGRVVERQEHREHYFVVFDELVCDNPACTNYHATHGPVFPEVVAVVSIVDMVGDIPWLFFDTAQQRDAFQKAMDDRDAGRPYDRTLTTRAL
jgi:hypothetical protein